MFASFKAREMSEQRTRRGWPQLARHIVVRAFYPLVESAPRQVSHYRGNFRFAFKPVCFDACDLCARGAEHVPVCRQDEFDSVLVAQHVELIEGFEICGHIPVRGIDDRGSGRVTPLSLM